jgi:hypothetical protein
LNPADVVGESGDDGGFPELPDAIISF